MKVLKEYPIPVPARHEKKRKKEIPIPEDHSGVFNRRYRSNTSPTHISH
jgi:hypothetical protein